jgi:uncharacterized protein
MSTSPSDALAFAEFRRGYGTLGDVERRTFALAHARAKDSGSGDGRLHIVGHAAVFNSPSVELRSPYGNFVEYIAPHAFDDVLASNPDCVLTWDHLTDKALARTTAGTLELSSNAHGLRFFASCSRTSYAEDLRVLMSDGVVTQSSFAFNVAPGCEDWTDNAGTITRTITKVGELYDICVTAAGAYPATDSGVARSLALAYALEHGHIRRHPAAALGIARVRADLDLRKRRSGLRT